MTILKMNLKLNLTMTQSYYDHVFYLVNSKQWMMVHFLEYVLVKMKKNIGETAS